MGFCACLLLFKLKLVHVVHRLMREPTPALRRHATSVHKRCKIEDMPRSGLSRWARRCGENRRYSKVPPDLEESAIPAHPTPTVKATLSLSFIQRLERQNACQSFP